MRDINITKTNTYLFFKDGKIVTKTILSLIELKYAVMYDRQYLWDFIVNAEYLQKDNETLGISFLGVDFLRNRNTKEFSKDQLECLYLNREQIGRAYCWLEQPGEQNK